LSPISIRSVCGELISIYKNSEKMEVKRKIR